MTKKALILVLLATVCLLAGCGGTLKLNHIAAGVECDTREACITAMGLDRQPANPDRTFVITPLFMDEKQKAVVGTPAIGGTTFNGDIDLCVAKELRNEFPNSSILLQSAQSPNSIMVKLNSVRAQGKGVGGLYMWLEYDLTYRGRIIPLRAESDNVVGWNGATTGPTIYPQLCKNAARQIKDNSR